MKYSLRLIQFYNKAGQQKNELVITASRELKNNTKVTRREVSEPENVFDYNCGTLNISDREKN